MVSSKDFAALLNQLAAASQPAITWYSPSERTELSGAVAARWIAKAANYLTADLALSAGMTVLLDLPPHWRTACWALGTLTAGGALTFADSNSADIVITTRPLAFTETIAEVVAIDTAPLALQYDGELAAMQHDGNAEVLAAADQLLPMPYGDGNDIALADTDTPYHQLDTVLAGGSAERVALRADDPWSFVRATISQLLAGGSVVGLAGEVDVAAICAQEGAQLPGTGA